MARKMLGIFLPLFTQASLELGAAFARSVRPRASIDLPPALPAPEKTAPPPPPSPADKTNAGSKPFPPPSPEQLAIAASVGGGFSVVVDAVAGSGKTTTVLHIAAASPGKRILLLTYNARLKTETRRRAAGLKNLEVHSYHSFGFL
jgi:hypothetical protein